MKTSKAIFILSAAIGAGTSVYADKVTFTQTPAAVQQAIKARSGSHEIEDIDRDNRNGKTTYEASWKNNAGVQQELLVSDNGSVLRDVAGDGPAVATTSSTTSTTGWQPRFGTANQNLQLSGGVKLQMSDAPQTVQQTIRNMANGAQIEDLERGTDMSSGRSVYQAAFKRNGQNTELQVYDDGSLVRRRPFGDRGARAYNNSQNQPASGFNQPRYAGLSDKNVALTSLHDLSLNQAPSAVQTSVNTMLNGQALSKFERGFWGDRLVYDAQYQQNGKIVELQFLEDGSLLTTPAGTSTALGAPASTATTSSAPTASPGAHGWRDTFRNAAQNLIGGSPNTATSGTSLSLSQTPVAVQQTVNNATKGAPLQSLQQETWNGRTAYDAYFQQNSQNMRLQVLDDGSILNMGPASAVGAPAGSQTGFGRQ